MGAWMGDTERLRLVPKVDQILRHPALADAAQLAYRYDKQDDLIWFRIALYGQPNKDTFGVNLVIDTGGDDSTKMSWWGEIRVSDSIGWSPPG